MPPPFAADAQLGPLEIPEPSAERPPTIRNLAELHFHSTREECWYVRGGSGIARIGNEAHELRAGSFWLRRPNGGVGHRIEVGPEGMDLVTMGDLVPADVVAYPERRIVRVARGVELPYEPKR